MDPHLWTEEVPATQVSALETEQEVAGQQAEEPEQDTQVAEHVHESSDSDCAVLGDNWDELAGYGPTLAVDEFEEFQHREAQSLRRQQRREANKATPSSASASSMTPAAAMPSATTATTAEQAMLQPKQQ